MACAPSGRPALLDDTAPESLDDREKQGQPLVSICLAHFNRPQELSEALESIKGLRYKNFEVVIVDDGSTNPEALAYLEEIEQQDHGFSLKVYSQPNLYLGASRNLAANHWVDWFMINSLAISWRAAGSLLAPVCRARSTTRSTRPARWGYQV